MDLNLENVKVYNGVSFADLLERIDKTSTQKSERISELTDMLSGMIDELDDAVVIVPLVKEYLEVDIKNDKQMVELAKIVQRLLTGYMRNADQIDSGNMGGDSLSDEEKGDLQEIAKQMRDQKRASTNEMDEESQREIEEFEKKANQALEKLDKSDV